MPHALSEADEEFLWNSGNLSKHSAQALVNVKFKIVTEHFGLRGRHEPYFNDGRKFFNQSW